MHPFAHLLSPTVSLWDNDSLGIPLVIIQGDPGQRLTKAYEIGQKPQAIANLVSGNYQTLCIRSVHDLIAIRAKLTAREAWILGQPADGVPMSGRLTTLAQFRSRGREAGVPRCNGSFVFRPDRPGIVCLDVDWDADTPYHFSSLQEGVDAVLKDHPYLRYTDYVAWPSSSSGVASRPFGAFHLYVAVAVSETADMLKERLCAESWVADRGYIKVSASGSVLVRQLMDKQVFQGSRLCFEAAPILGPGVTRDAAIASQLVRHEGRARYLDVPGLPPCRAITRESAARIRKARDNPAVWETQEARRTEHSYVMQSTHGWDEERRIAYILTLRQSHEKALLFDDVMLDFADGMTFSVGAILDNPEPFVGMPCACPYGEKPGQYDKCYVMRKGQVLGLYHHPEQQFYAFARRPEDDEVEAEGRDYSFAELAALPLLEWRIKGILPKAGVVVVYGAPGTAKSFIVLNMLRALTEPTGTKWFGQRCKAVRDAYYIVYEGLGGMPQRLRALQQTGADLQRVTFRDGFRDLRDGGHKHLLAHMASRGLSGDLVIIDTLAQSLPGFEENSSVDMGKAISAAQAIQRTTGGLVLLVHHSGKDASRGMRGHSSLLGAVDASLECCRELDDEGRVTERYFRVHKAKDGSDGERYDFELDVREVARDEWDEPVTSCVIKALDSDLKRTGELELIEALVKTHYANAPGHTLRLNAKASNNAAHKLLKLLPDCPDSWSPERIYELLRLAIRARKLFLESGTDNIVMPEFV